MEKIFSSSNFDFYSPDFSELELDYVGNIRAGFLSPAEDFSEDKIDLNKLLIRHPEATFYAKVKGNSMTEDFQEGDLLIIDRSVEYAENKVALCFIDGEFTLKRIKYVENKCFLAPSNDEFLLIEVHSIRSRKPKHISILPSTIKGARPFRIFFRLTFISILPSTIDIFIPKSL